MYCGFLLLNSFCYCLGDQLSWPPFFCYSSFSKIGILAGERIGPLYVDPLMLYCFIYYRLCLSSWSSFPLTSMPLSWVHALLFFWGSVAPRSSDFHMLEYWLHKEFPLMGPSKQNAYMCHLDSSDLSRNFTGLT